MTSSQSVAMETKKPAKSAALPHQVSRALVTPQMKQMQRSKSGANPGDKPAKDLATPTAAFLGGGEMVPAPMVRLYTIINVCALYYIYSTCVL